MSEHLSPLALDELAVGDATDAAKAHLDDCASCRLKLDAVRAAALQVTSMPAFEQTLAALEQPKPAATPAPGTRRRLLTLVAVAVPLAAALVFFVLSPRDGGIRLKGAPSLELLAKDGPVTSGWPGEMVTLAVGGAGHSHALVFSIDESGTVSRLWPADARAAPIAAGARVLLSPSLDITPGSFLLVGFFSEAAQPASPVSMALEEQVAAAKKKGNTPLELETPTAFGSTARLRFEVHP